MNNLPFVSVIVPVFNSKEFIAKNIESLLNQDYPKERYEILVVDNGSTDGTKNIIQKYHVTFLEENNIQSSYAARNKGIAHAKGEIFAFTDADCIAESGWLSYGINYMLKEKADLIGGKVRFFFSSKPTAAEMVDSLINMNNKRSIETQGVAKTANIMVHRRVFDNVGLFLDSVTSGGDIEWTARATKKSFILKYCENAVVSHPTRSFSELMKKHYRVGSGSVQAWRGRGKSYVWIVIAFLGHLVPYASFKVFALIRKNGESHVRYFPVRMAWVMYMCKLATAAGIVSNIFKKTRSV